MTENERNCENAGTKEPDFHVFTAHCCQATV